MKEIGAIEQSMKNAPEDISCWDCVHRESNLYWAAGFCKQWRCLIEYPPRMIIGFDRDDPDLLIETKPVIRIETGCDRYEEHIKSQQGSGRYLRKLKHLFEFLGW